MKQDQPDAARPGKWATRLGTSSFRLALAAVAVAATGLTLARYDVIPKLSGFSAFLASGLIAVAALLLALVSLFAGRRAAYPSRGKALIGLVISLGFVGFLGSRPLAAGDAPAIHDITTDLANPPQFEVLSLRADNLTGVGTEENWRRIHAEAYADLSPVIIAKPVAAVTADVIRLAGEAGWQVAASDPARGHVEATASVSYIRFRDDVVIRIIPQGDGTSSRVDMRSVSRVGVSDLGVNARRIREFLKRLSEA